MTRNEEKEKEYRILLGMLESDYLKIQFKT
jgi:hypothetical protein